MEFYWDPLDFPNQIQSNPMKIQWQSNENLLKPNGIQWNSNGIMLQKAYACKPSYKRCSLFWGCVIFQNPKKIVEIVDIVGGGGY